MTTLLNLLANPSFEGLWTTLYPSGNQVPTDWTLIWRLPDEPMLSAGAFAFGTDKVLTTPECVHKDFINLPADEWPGAEDALVLCGKFVYKLFGRGCSASLEQTVGVESGTTVTLAVPVQVHSHGDDALGAVAVRIWINDTVGEWQTFGAGLVDRQWITLQLTATINSSVASIGLDFEARSVNYALDCFVDAVMLVKTSAAQPEVDYVVVFELLPQNVTRTEMDEAVDVAFADKRTYGQSADDARRMVAPGLPGSKVNVWAGERWPGGIAGIDTYLRAGGVQEIEYFEFSTPPPPPPPPPVWTPTNYTPGGTKITFHCIGSYPLDIVNQLAASGVTLPAIKLVQSLGDLNNACEPYRLGRILDHNGVNLEGFDYSLSHGTPEQQAQNRMAALMPLFAPYKSKLAHIELINEQAPPSNIPNAHTLLARFFIEASNIAHANGYHIAAFSHSLGEPKLSAWDEIADSGVFETLASHGDAIALHEYGDASYGPGDIICRYRYLYETIILPRRLNIPLYISEYNLLPFIPYQGSTLEQWQWYDALIRQDPYVVAATLFTLPYGMGWDDYANLIVPNLQGFVQYAIQQKDVPNG